MRRTLSVTLALGAWAAEGFRPAAAVIGMRPSHDQLLGVNLPDEHYARDFPDIPDGTGVWILTCDVELPVAYDEYPEDEVFALIGPEQLLWLPATAEWRHANQRDLYILRGEVPPGEGDETR